MLTIHETMITEQTMLTQRIQTLKEQLATLPPGELFIRKNGSHYKHYLKEVTSNGTSTRYLPKDEQHNIEQLAVKKYLNAELQDCENELFAIRQYLTARKQRPTCAPSLLASDSPFRNLLSSHFSTFDEKLKDWMDKPFFKNTAHPEQLKYKSSSGNLVRSKSEYIIDSMLYLHHIPFRYECELILDGVSFYPDFTILHPVSGQIFYWEHLGLLDNPSYLHSCTNKLQIYMKHNILPSHNLILTYESSQFSFDPNEVERLISYHFES